MDKSRDVRRGKSRFSRQQINTNKKQQSRPNLFFGFDGGGDGGGGGDLEKARKEKIRRLSSVNGNRGSPGPSPNSNQYCETEMGSCCCDLSSDNRENQCPSHSQHSSTSLITNSITKRFKVHKRFLDDCNVVDHASVPRKLRSAMKKRGRESISPPLPDSKKLNHTLRGFQSHKKDGVKKAKMNSKRGESDWSRKAITKDEEEVVETLYALAGMFPDGDLMDKNNLSGEPTPPEIEGSPVTAIEVKKEDTNSVRYPQAAEIVPSATIDESSNEASKLSSSDEPTTQDQPDLAISINHHMKPDSSIFSLAKSEADAEKSSCIPGIFHVLSEQCSETRLKQPTQQVTNIFERKPKMAFEVASIESQMAQQHVLEPRKNGLALWPGFSSTVPLGALSPGSSQSSATKIPAWLDAAMFGPRTCSLESGYSTEKVSKVTLDRKSMKRCTAHVYISSLIRNLQMQDSKDNILQQPIQLKSHVGLKQTALLYPKNCTSLRSDINCVSGSSGISTTERNSSEARSGILQQTMFHQERPQVASASGMHASQRQSFDFLSLSAGGVSTEANNSFNKIGNTVEPLPKLQVPYFHPLPQHQSLRPFSIAPTRLTSSAYIDQLSTAAASQQVQLQLPQHPNNPFSGPPYTSHSGVAKHQQQQQQQRLWAAHLAAQYRHGGGGTSAVLTQFPSWQNGKPESPCPQTAFPPHSTLDAAIGGPKYNTVQHPKMTISSSFPFPPTTSVKRSDHYLPSVYEESNGGIRPGGALPLQLLCNERL